MPKTKLEQPETTPVLPECSRDGTNCRSMVHRPGRIGAAPRIGLALGVFDYCHEGHVQLLRQARARCDRLVVGVHTDDAAHRYKNHYPDNSEAERRLAIERLGIAEIAIVNPGRERLCMDHGVTDVFHGDDWTLEAYRLRFGRELISRLGLRVHLLPHVPGISSTDLRHNHDSPMWWLLSGVPGWGQAHIFEHLRDAYAELGGVWYLDERSRDEVRAAFPGAPIVLCPKDLTMHQAVRWLGARRQPVIVTANAACDELIEALGAGPVDTTLILLSHGRSGKPGASYDLHRRRRHLPGAVRDGDKALRYCDGTVHVHDLTFVDDVYVRFDAFLAAGGRLDNPVPSSARPRVLVAPTHQSYPARLESLLHEDWHRALRRLGRWADVCLIPHPLTDVRTVDDFAVATRCRVLPADGRAIEHMPNAHLVISDLSGVFWEALAFDTPVLLNHSAGAVHWPEDASPGWAQVRDIVPIITPRTLNRWARRLNGARQPTQRILAEERLGRLDGRATQRLSQRIRQIITEGGTVRTDETAPRDRSAFESDGFPSERMLRQSAQKPPGHADIAAGAQESVADRFR